VHLRERLLKISASSTFRNIFLKILVLSFSEESKKKKIDLDPKIPNIPRMTISRLFFKKLSSLKLLTTSLISISKEKASTIS